MTRKLAGGKLVIASHNDGKIREIRELLAPFGIEAVSVASFGFEPPEETEETFDGNAAIKARAAVEASGLPALADDSGLEIEALDGRPGVHAADWAEPPDGGPRDFAMAMARVEREMRAAGAETSPARFVCCLCVAWPDGHLETFLGAVHGTVAFPPRGGRGFGYDPIFTPEGRTETFGEMDPAEKHGISHRARAFEKLKAACAL